MTEGTAGKRIIRMRALESFCSRFFLKPEARGDYTFMKFVEDAREIALYLACLGIFYNMIHKG